MNNIPSKFIIHTQEIKVILKDVDLEDTRYGYYDSVKEEIVLFRKIKSNGETVELTEKQIEMSFYHELCHAFQWHIKGETDEWEAQSYAGLIMEFLNTKE